MPLPQPKLDDKNFQELLEEAQKLIPIYAPEWTDYNIHDPGITFIELFAWLAEMQMYRLDQITEKNKLKFLKILGEKPTPATSAIVEVTFSNHGTFSITLPQNTQLSSLMKEQPAEKIVFETVKEINVIPQKLIKIFSQDIYGITDNTSANGMEGHYYYAFGKTAGKNSILYLGFEEISSEVKISFMVYFYEKDLIERGKHGEELPKIYPSARVRWEYKNRNNDWAELKVEDETLQFTFSGSVSLQIPSDIAKSILSFSKDKLCWIRCRVIQEGFEIPPRVEAIRLNTVTAIQKEQVKGGSDVGVYLGTSKGLPNQTFCLPLPPSKTSHPPLKDDSCTNQADENPVMANSVKIISVGNGLNLEWFEVSDFAASKEDDPHFRVDLNKGVIFFGDGINGMIPPAEHEINATYTHIDGVKGNVAAGQINLILGDDLKDLEVSNEKAATGGSDSETIEEAIIRVRKDLRTPYTAVTSNDYRELAKSTPGLRVKRAKTLVDKNNNMVTVLVVPESIPENFLSEPKASSGFLKTVCNHLDKHRLITTQIQVDNPKYVKVSVDATLKPEKGYDDKLLNNNANEALINFLNPFTGYDGNGWPFGRDVFISEIYEVLDNVSGVDCVFKVKIDGKKEFNGEKLVIDENELVYSGEHHISILGLGEECGRGRYL